MKRQDKTLTGTLKSQASEPPAARGGQPESALYQVANADYQGGEQEASGTRNTAPFPSVDL